MLEVIIFRNRKHSVLVRLNEHELLHLRSLVKASGLPQENLLRKIILGYQVKASPPIEYQEIIGQLMSIGNSINQIAAKLSTYGKSQGRSGSYSTNYQQSGRELLMPDEVRLLNNADALLFVRGERAMRDAKKIFS